MFHICPLFPIVLLCILTVWAQFEDDQSDLNEAWFTEDMYNETYFEQLREKKYGIIAPGTKWCGQGDKADNYEDLGRFNRTDVCCRAHDNCPVVIAAGTILYDLLNPDSSSRLSCECDSEFYQCLKEIQDLPSKTIGTIYFDILKKKCLNVGVDGKSYVWHENPRYSNGRFIGFLRRFY